MTNGWMLTARRKCIHSRRTRRVHDAPHCTHAPPHCIVLTHAYTHAPPVCTPHRDSESETGSPLGPRSPRKHSQRTRTSNAAAALTPSPNGIAAAVQAEAETIAADASSVTRSLKNSTRRSLDNLASVFRSNVAHAEDEAREVAHDAQNASHAAVRRVKAQVRRVEKQLHKAYAHARNEASDAGNLVRLLLIVEAVFLVLAVLPTHYLQLGQSRTESLLHGHLTRSAAAARLPHWAITVPDVRGLATTAFWHPILLWVGWTVALPSLAAHLITFQRRHEPSPITFTYVRLALLVFLGGHLAHSAATHRHTPYTLGVAAGHPAAADLEDAVAGGVLGAGSTTAANVVASVRDALAYDAVVPLDLAAQILATALAAGIATYEAIAVRPRASH